MKKAKIYIPSKTAMQSGIGKKRYWVLEFETNDTFTSPLMGWESSDDTLGEVKLKFSSKDKALDYAKKNNINFRLIEPKIKSFVIKSYADNFTKD
ncbi:MAG: ETC complex I subunit [Pelagibacteraceae bacterium]